MLIIEGPDLVGKTTLAHKIVKQMQALHDRPTVYQHFSRLPKSWDHYRHYIPYITPRTVMDRFIISELVYGKVCRNTQSIDAETLRLLEARLAMVGSMTIVITSTPDFLARQWRDRKREEMYELEHVIAVNEEYTRVLASVSYDVHYIVRDQFVDDTAVDRLCGGWQQRLLNLERRGEL